MGRIGHIVEQRTSRRIPAWIGVMEKLLRIVQGRLETILVVSVHILAGSALIAAHVPQQPDGGVAVNEEDRSLDVEEPCGPDKRLDRLLLLALQPEVLTRLEALPDLKLMVASEDLHGATLFFAGCTYVLPEFDRRWVRCTLMEKITGLHDGGVPRLGSELTLFAQEACETQ